MKKIYNSISGVLNFFFKPSLKDLWGGPFNGQRFRQKIFFDILYALPIKSIVETGTFLGSTTALFSATALPVYTVERSKKFYFYSKTRFLLQGKNLHMFSLDSRKFLLSGFSSGTLPIEDVFFYLDAHWGRVDLPLLEELDIIFSSCSKSVVMIDDFCVPDTSYAYDSYGAKKTLNLDYIRPIIEKYGVEVFFPIIDANLETGGQVGSVILCLGEQAKLLDCCVDSLRRHLV